MSAILGFINFIRNYYDKLIALAALVAVLLAGVQLALNQRVDVAEETAYEERLDALKPAHPTLAPVGLVTYSNSLRQLTNPYRIALQAKQKAGFFVPESRVWCVNRDCRFPIPRESTNCPVCKTEQTREPEEYEGYDSDGGGIPDEWEIKYGLNPLDPADDIMDSDGDGFTNLEEYLAGTDPLDPKSHPDLVDFLRVEKITATRLPMKFMAVTEMPKGHRIQINVWEDGKRSPNTYFVVTNQMIGKTDFKLLSYDEVTGRRISPITGTEMAFSEKSIKISRGQTVKTLKLGQDASQDDYVITFIHTREDKRDKVSGDEFIKVGEEKYRVISVDKETTSVVLQSDSDDTKITVPKL